MSNEPTYKSFNDDLDDGGLGCFHIEDESADCKFCTPRGGGASGGGGAHDSIERVGCFSSSSSVHAMSGSFPTSMGIEDQLKKVKIPGPSALALSAHGRPKLVPNGLPAVPAISHCKLLNPNFEVWERSPGENNRHTDEILTNGRRHTDTHTSRMRLL